MKTSRVTTLLLTVATTITSSHALGSSCPNIPDPLYPYKTAPGWSYLKVGGGLHSPRDLVLDGKGRLLIIEEGLGLSQHIVDANGCITNSRLLISDPDLNHGICLSADGKILYASSSSSVFSWTYDAVSGDVDQDPVLVVSGMATSGHVTRTLAVPPHRDDLLVVSHGSDRNIDEETSDARTARAIVKVFNVSSVPMGGWNYISQGWNAGFGLRNEVGLAFDGNNMLWGVENSADNLARTINGTTTDVHADNPAEELNYLGDVTVPNDDWYGYPVCFTVWNPTELSFDRAFKVGQQFVQVPTSSFNDETCAQVSVPPVLSFQAHSAPLGCKFDAKFSNLFVAMHGSWNRDMPTGYKVVAVPFAQGPDGAYAPTAASWSVRGSIDVFYPPDETACSSETCVRPVGLAFDGAGRLYVTSDASGEVFLLSQG
ncbi:soluble quino protein glucose dehydrogenase [Xylaria bambusicola]|uniref:soluble quino protein glucose dehydrogenase n=1 Tax=Xylaria bambusicola TaxID=326684 RepID=UPI0020075699|nr:soluble quino protein glucose dehydrogenase [Xylaria bambusicola]KAI0508837.1 soluble quino protein glucose dehydrogenase [Xylaria bambusicola]